MYVLVYVFLYVHILEKVTQLNSEFQCHEHDGCMEESLSSCLLYQTSRSVEWLCVRVCVCVYIFQPILTEWPGHIVE